MVIIGLKNGFRPVGTLLALDRRFSPVWGVVLRIALGWHWTGRKIGPFATEPDRAVYGRKLSPPGWRSISDAVKGSDHGMQGAVEGPPLIKIPIQ